MRKDQKDKMVSLIFTVLIIISVSDLSINWSSSAIAISISERLAMIEERQGPPHPPGPPSRSPTFETVRVEDTVQLPGGPIGLRGTASAECPVGTALTGGGYFKSPDVDITNEGPSADNLKWEVSGVNQNPPVDGFITAIAECGSNVVT